MAKGKWEVASMPGFLGKRVYIAFRKINASLPNSPSNIELFGEYPPDRQAVEALATLLNEKEAES